jgi:hypothetical protein
MKTLKFRPHLVPQILSGEKFVTWRLFDDKDIQVGDQLQLVEFGALKQFAQAEAEEVTEKPLGELTEEDWIGHEKFKSETEMYETYSNYYGREVGPETIVKMIRIKLK